MISNPFQRVQSTPSLRAQLARLRDYRSWPDELSTTGKRWVEQVGELVGRYPAAAVAVAFSLGIGAGWWIKRK